MSTQRHNATTGTANVAKQELHNSCSTYNLHTLGLLRPTNCIADGRGAFTSRVLDERLRNLHPLVAWHAAHLLYHFRSVARIMATHDLEDALRMLQCEISQRLPIFITLVVPTALVGIGA